MRRLIKSFVISSFYLISNVNTLFSQSVDPLTGKVSVNIPLWTIKSGSLSYPIALSYYGDGVRINDVEQSAGMNWSVSTGGAIIRHVHGLPDDFVGARSGFAGDLRNGWLHGSTAKQVDGFIPSADLNYNDCSDEVNDWNALTAFGYTIDTEPDLFTISAPGLSCKFFFDKNKRTVTTPFRDLKIEPARNSDSLIYQITITNNLGIKYIFQNGEMITRYAYKNNQSAAVNYFTSNYNYYNTPVFYYDTWHLTQVTSPVGEQLNFFYTLGSSKSDPNYVRIIDNATNSVDTLYSDNQLRSTFQLLSVAGNNEKATFAWNGDFVGSITIQDLTYQTTAKKFVFQYNYVTGSYKGYKRAFLAQMTEQVDCNAFPGYQFGYYGVNFTSGTTSIPFSSPLGQDLFGYYDSTAVSEVPELYVASGDTGLDGERYRISPASGYSLIATGGGRSVSGSKIYYGSLKTMVTPDGGTSTIAYEAADYYDYLTNSTITGGGIRVKQVKILASSNPASAVVTTYSYKRSKNNSQSSGQWTYRPMFAFSDGSAIIRTPDNLAPDGMILYSRVEVSTSGRGRVIYEFQNQGIYNQTSSGDFSATLSRMARSVGGSCPSIGTLKSGYYTFPFPSNTNYDFERGLSTRVSSYTADRKKIVSQKSYTYQRTALPVTQVSGVHFEKLGTIFQYGKYALLSNVDKVILTETNRTYAQNDTTQYAESATTYTYNANGMLSQVSSVNSDNASYSTTFKYVKDYAGSGTDTQSQMIGLLVTNNQHGTMVETVSYAGSSVTDARLTLFNNTYGGNRVLPSQVLTLGDPSNFVPSTISGNAFTYSGHYFPATNFDVYDAIGHPLVTRDQSRRVSSVMMGYNNTIPSVEIANARYDQIVYSDFEPTLNTSLTTTGTISSSDSWSGKNSLALNNASNASQNTVARGNGNFYRFSCWAKSSTSVNLTVQFYNGTSWVANTVAYPSEGASTGTWQYMEKRIDVSSIPANTNFGFQLLASGNTSVDNLAFYPESSEIIEHTYDPLIGKTADLDSRGKSAFEEYDALGRVHYLKNMDKDIVLIKDYHYKSSSGMAPISHFTYNPQIKTGDAVTFTADPSCVPGVTYLWYVDGVNQNITASSFTYTFSLNKDYRVKLATSSPNNGGSATEVLIHPIAFASGTMTLSGGAPTYINCNTGLRTLTPTVTLAGCYETANTTYDWWMSTDGNPDQHMGTTTSGTYSPLGISTNTAYVIKCYVNTTCLNQNTKNHEPLNGILVTKSYVWDYDTCGSGKN